MNGATRRILLLQRREVDLLAGHRLLPPRLPVEGRSSAPDAFSVACLARELAVLEHDTNPTNAMSITATPSTVRMYVPVELAGPNVQKPAMSSLHSSYGKRVEHRLAPFLGSGSDGCRALPFVCQYASSRTGAPSTSRPSGSMMTSGTRSNSG